MIHTHIHTVTQFLDNDSLYHMTLLYNIPHNHSESHYRIVMIIIGKLSEKTLNLNTFNRQGDRIITYYL